jgi:glycosyltransferase involved in cell wall biosynthesis
MPEPPERIAIAQAPLSVVLPAYNAEAVLEPVLAGWAAYLDGLGRDYEILVVDDGSTDGTGGLAEALRQKYPRVRCLRHPTRSGFGAALRTGLAEARYPLFFYTECSLSYQPTDLKLLLEAIDPVDLASGYRVGKSWSWNDFVFRWLTRLLFGIRLKDVDCSFKLFRRSIFARIPIQSNGDFVHAEIVAKANFLGCLLTEVPIAYRPNPAAVPSHLSRRQRWAEAVKVFRHPDFGPARLPEQPVPTQPANAEAVPTVTKETTSEVS